jgi:hypothetical protein
MIVMALLAIAGTGIVRRQQLRTVALDIGTAAGTPIERLNEHKPTLDAPQPAPTLPAALVQAASIAPPAPAGSQHGAPSSRPSRSSPQVIQKPKPAPHPVKPSQSSTAKLSPAGTTRASTEEPATTPASDAEPAVRADKALAPVELDDEPATPER